MSLRGALRSSVAAACILAVAAPAVAPAALAASSAQLDVRVAQAKRFSRIEFHWAGGARFTQTRQGQVLTLRFNRDATPDLSRLRVIPPKWVKTAEARHEGGRLEVAITLAEGAAAKVGQADGAIFVNVFEKPPEPALAKAVEPTPEAPKPAPRPPRANPVPANGVVRLQAEMAGPQVKLRFDWKNPLGAAVFRRGEAVWVVFDAPAAIDVTSAPTSVSQFSQIHALKGADYSALRIVSPRGTPVSVEGQGASWIVAFGPGRKVETGEVAVERDDESAYAQLSATLAGAQPVVWLDDPAVGDRLAVVPALAPAKGLTTRREYVEMALLPTIHGMAIESYSGDLSVAAQGDLVRIGRPEGLALSPTSAGRKQIAAAEGAPQPASMPGLVDPTWAKTHAGFIARYDALVAAAAEETAKGANAPVAARMALARFLVGNELSYEAIGVLNNAVRARQTLMSDAEFRALRGIAKVMAGRLKEAETDFATTILSDDPASQLWRGYIAAKAGNYAEARQKFAAGLIAQNQFDTVWRARFATADAEAALALGDPDSARSRLTEVFQLKTPAKEAVAARLVQARLFEAQGQQDRALAVYTAITRAPLEQLAAPALLRATQIRLDKDEITPLQAAGVFDGLRYRWRGDATELETIRLLGKLYLNQGRYREALEALRSAGQRLPDLPQAVGLQNDLADAFRALFLDGLADGLQPVQALALFYDFKDLTPIGADGDLMVRKLVRRLVDVDLLGPAGDLLKYQVDNRLDGVPKAQVATDLALIYLMDRKPEQAMQAINGSRTTLLPTVLNTERRIITARALIGLGRLEAAAEIVASDKSPEVADIRAEIAWRQHDWPGAGAKFETLLGERWKNDMPLRVEEEGKLLRAGVAYSLAGDEASLARLRERYRPFFEQARNPEALSVAFAGMDDSALSANDFSRAVADNEGFAGWVARMKQRFRDEAGPSATKQAASGQTAAG